MYICLRVFVFFFFKHKTAYEMRISDWSSDVCSSDLHPLVTIRHGEGATVLLDIEGQGAQLLDCIDAQKHAALLAAFAQARKIQPHAARILHGADRHQEIGRASCRERVCQYV